MRGVFGGLPSGMQYNREKRASLDGLAARQQAVALAMERQQKEKAALASANIRSRGARVDPAVPETGMFPSISPRSVPPPYPPAVGGGYGVRQQQQTQAQQQARQRQDREDGYRFQGPPTAAVGPATGTSSEDSQKLYDLLSSISGRLNGTDDLISGLQSGLSSLHTGHSSMEMRVSSLPTMKQLADLKQQLEGNTVLMNEAAKKSNEAMMEANKLGLQLYEQNTALGQLQELGKDFEKVRGGEGQATKQMYAQQMYAQQVYARRFMARL